jgi:hypothetical protein
MTRSSSALSVVVAVLLGPACIVHDGEPRPLYTKDQPPLPPEQTARLFGPIATVDGDNVSKQGRSFTLLPGCHIVRLLEKIGEINTSNGGGFIGTIGHVVFALRMKAGYTYEIEASMPTGTNHPVNQMTIQAWERAADGSGATAIAPAKYGDELSDCRKWTP